jgi:hypothetical protein
MCLPDTSSSSSSLVTKVAKQFAVASNGRLSGQRIENAAKTQQQQYQQQLDENGERQLHNDKFARLDLPWYIRGGMQTNLLGMGMNILIPPVLWASWQQSQPIGHGGQLMYYAIYLGCIAAAKYICHMKTIFCTLVVSTYFCSLGLAFWVWPRLSPLLVVLAFGMGMIKVGIPMSICLHRYAAHQAFTCGPIVKWFLLILSCLAHQGGPLWWAATHRAHHKFCDTPGDPHSPQVDGVERAFAFFWVKIRVLKDFVPRHLQANDAMWALDTFAFAVHTVELGLAYLIGGHPLMFVAYTSAWMCQVTTLWFNVINHPEEEPKGKMVVVAENDDRQNKKNDVRMACAASNYKSNGLLHLPPGTAMAGRFVPFHVLNVTNYFFAQLSAEDQHQHHHANARLAQRSPGDFFYWTFVYPLEATGLVWDVQHYKKKNVNDRKQE